MSTKDNPDPERNNAIMAKIAESFPLLKNQCPHCQSTVTEAHQAAEESYIEKQALLADNNALRRECAKLLDEERKNLAWIENLLADIHAKRPLRPGRIAEGLTMRRDKVRAAIAKATR